MPKLVDIPDFPTDWKKPSFEAGQTVRSYEIELITPMFGGGVEPRVNDRRMSG
jgi:hypothetical protein